MRPHTSQSEFEAKIAKVSEIDWARLAAFIDGEGSILISKHKSRERQNYQYNLEVVVSGTDVRLIRWLQDTFSGRVYIICPSPKSFRSNKPCQTWRIFEERAEAVLLRCLPYFIVKGEQAKIALDFRALKRQGSKGRKLTPEVLQQRDEFRQKMQVMNSSWRVSGQ